MSYLDAKPRKLVVVPTPHEGRLLEADRELCRDLARHYQVTVLANVRDSRFKEALPELRDPIWLQPLLAKSPQTRLLYLLRPGLHGSPGVLANALRHPGFVLLGAGSLLETYRRLYLERGALPDFAGVLGKESHVDSEVLLSRILLGLGHADLPHRTLMLRSLAKESPAIATSSWETYERLKKMGAANRRILLPAPYALLQEADSAAEATHAPVSASQAAFPGPVAVAEKLFSRPEALSLGPGAMPRIVLFGETLPKAFVAACHGARKVFRARGVALDFVTAVFGTAEGALPATFHQTSPSAELFHSGATIIALPEGPNPGASAALATSLAAGAVTMTPASPDLRILGDAFLPLRTWPHCGAELTRHLWKLHTTPGLQELLSKAAIIAARRIPSRNQRLLELVQAVELSQNQRPPGPPRLKVWQDVLGIRFAELQCLTVGEPGQDLWRATRQAARELQTSPSEGGS